MNWDIIDNETVCHKFKSGLFVVLKHDRDNIYVCSVRRGGKEILSFHVKAANMSAACSIAVKSLNKAAATAIREWYAVTEATDACLDAISIAKLDDMCRNGTLSGAHISTARDRLGRVVDIEIPAEQDGPVKIRLNPKSAGAAMEAVSNLNIRSMVFMRAAENGGTPAAPGVAGTDDGEN